MESKVAYQTGGVVAVEVEAGVRRLNLYNLMTGKRPEAPELRAAFLAGAYKMAEIAGLDRVPSEIFDTKDVIGNA